MYKRNPGVSWDLIICIFLWLLLIFIVILTDSNESIKEELGIVIKEQVKEIQVLREINKEQLLETKLLREDLNGHHRKLQESAAKKKATKKKATKKAPKKTSRKKKR
ncbi:hypothetical protein ACFL0W_01665 [Nanoarchaeota archaeon]